MSEREILFRGKRSNGEWIEGSLLKVNFSGEIYNLIFGDKFIGLGDSKMESLSHAAVIPETVGRYTGLTDKNGTKIFEKDIVKISRAYIEEFYVITEVFSYRGVLCVNYKTADYDFNALAFLDDDNEFIFEVIGNIHDNPELLKGA